MEVNAALRQALKDVIDKQTRAEVIPAADHPGFCVECRMPWDTQTPDCRTCSNRHHRREPAQRARQSARHKQKFATDAAYRERRRAVNNSRKRQQRARERDTA